MRYLFGDCVFDTDRHTLERQGQGVRLQSRVFKMLAYLLEQRHRVVPRQELFEQVWSGQYVSKAALDGCIKRVRQVIGDSGQAQRLLKTQHGVGYRFVVPVTVEEVAVTQPQVADLPSQASPSAPLAAPLTTGPERRQLTMLSCTLANAPHLRTQLDPDDLHAVMRAFHVLCTDIVSQFGGSIAQRSDDGCLIYFGYPSAHDDDARRAVLAGLHFVAAVIEGSGPLKVGIHTGVVVVEPFDDATTPSALVVGDVATVASALRDRAAPQTVLISATTARLVEGYVTWQTSAPYTPPGHSETIAVYRVTGESGAQLRLDTMPAHHLTPFVGRETEQAVLDARWAQACEGRGQAVVVSGEAGIGKSRLVRRLAEHLSDTGCTILEGRGSPYHMQTAFYSISNVLRLMFGLSDLPKTKDPLSQCKDALQQYGLDAQAHLPLVAPLVNLTLSPECDTASQLTPQRRRQRTFESLLALFIALADKQPVLFVLEDLHWMDPSTLEWLDLLLDQTPSAAILLLLTCRPEFEPSWPLRSYLTQVTLDRLTPSQSTQIVKSIARNAPMPAPVVHQIVEHSDGVPLFIEELTRAVLDTGSTAKVPMTLQDALMARLDQVGEARRTAQLGAVIGRQFDDALLRTVSPLDEAFLHQDLHCLVDSELLYRRGVGTDATYRFKHALIQDAAYQSLLRRTRQQYHQRIAQVLEEHFPETAETQPELLAHHYTEADRQAQAVVYWQRAGQRALERSAYVEATRHLSRGLEVLHALPDTPERAQHELTFHTTFGPALMATKGQTAPEVGDTYARARELCQQLGETSQLFPVLIGLWRFHIGRGELQTSRDLGEQCLALAEPMHDPALLLEAHMALGRTLLLLCEFVLARQHLERGIALYDRQQHHAHTTFYVRDPGVICGIYAAHALWYLGYPDQALVRSHDALTLAQEQAHPLSLALALHEAAVLHRFRREPRVTQERAEAAISLINEQELGPWMLGRTMIERGWALATQGDGEAGIAQIQQGLNTLRALGASTRERGYQLAEAYLHKGQAEEGLRVVPGDPMGLWLRGELLLRQAVPDPQQAETCWQQALDVARAQQAKSSELRATTSLARLWQSQGKRQDAHDLLAPVYNWFTEGFDTADLKEAKGLLDELAEGAT